MIGRNRTSEDYRHVLDPKRARRDLLYRAGLGTVLIVLMVVGLTVYDRGGPADDEPAPDRDAGQAVGVPTPPVVSRPVEPAPEPEPERVREPSLSSDDPDEAPPTGEPSETAPETTESTEQDVAESVAESTETVEPEPDASAAAPASALEASSGQAVTPPPAAAPPKASAPRSAPAVQSSGYRLQVGGFLDAEAFDRLVPVLADQDFPVVTQYRVSVGPYTERSLAGDAAARLRRERAVRGIVIPLSAGGGYAVQTGVFAGKDNADALSRNLTAWGYPVQLHRRAIAGPFPDRNVAEVIRTKLRQEQGIDSVIVEPSR